MLDLNSQVLPVYRELYYDIKDRKHSEYFIYGGRGGGKSYFATRPILMSMLTDKEINTIVLMREHKYIKNSVFNEYLKALTALGIYDKCKIMLSSPLKIILPTGNHLIFYGCDEPEKLKSITTEQGFYGYIHVEEADKLQSFGALTKIKFSAFRGSPKPKSLIMVFNPPEIYNHWIYNEIDAQINTRFVKKVGYQDVPQEYLGDDFFKTIEDLRTRNELGYRNQILGERVNFGNGIFKHLHTFNLEDKIESFDLDRITAGIDFGYYDPYVCVLVIKQDNNIYILDEYVIEQADEPETIIGTRNLIRKYKKVKESKVIFHHQKQHDDQLEDLVNGQLLICDSEDINRINNMKRAGLNAIPVRKWPGSVAFTMEWLNQYNIHIASHCEQALNEFYSYSFPLDKDMNVMIGQYPDKDNHIIDAVRYALMYYWQ